MPYERTIIIKLSGIAIGSSIDCDFDYLGRFGQFIARLDSSWAIAVTVGGGDVARHYIAAAKYLGLSDSKASILGGDIGLINSRLAIAALTRAGVKMHGTPVESFADAESKLKAGLVPVLFGRWPALTSDSVAAYFADYVSADLVLKLSRINSIYDRDPKHADAVPNRRLTHEQLEWLSSQNDHRIAGEEFVIDFLAAKRLRNSNIPLWLLHISKLELATAILSGGSRYEISEGTLVGDLRL